MHEVLPLELRRAWDSSGPAPLEPPLQEPGEKSMTSSARSKHSSSIALMMFLTASRPETSSSIAEFAITVSVKAAVVAKDSWSFASLDAPEMAMAPHSTSNPKSKRSSP